MSDLNDANLELPLEDGSPKKKVARKRVAKKAARKAARKKAADVEVSEKVETALPLEAPEAVEQKGGKFEHKVREDQEEPIPERFSADPDDMDDYGSKDRSYRKEQAEEAFESDLPQSSGEVVEEAEKVVTPEAVPQNATAPGQANGEGQGGEHQHRGHFKKDKFFKKKNKFSGDRGPNPQQQHQQSQQQQGGNNFKKNKFNKNNGKRNKPWQAGFASVEDMDQDEPSFESLPGWDLFQNEESLSAMRSRVAHQADRFLDYNEVISLTQPQLEARAREENIRWEGPPRRRELIRLLLEKANADGVPIRARGILEVLESEHGFIVFARDNYRIKTDSPFIHRSFIERYALQRGHELEVWLHAAKDNETCPFVIKVLSVMGMDPEEIQHMTPFKELVPYYPTERVLLECSVEKLGKWDNISMRVVDLLTPLGLGQRGLIVAPPRTGKTVLLQGIANAISINRPDVHLIILLVDERPEEVTDFRRQVKSAEVISSTFDESPESHIHAAEMVIEKARRMVEHGKHVVILLDSITRLARAYNAMMPNSGKILSGGVEAGALQKPKRFFGSARNIEGGGSLTILGTALVDTGSKMDEVIFEEFKGTGNMELHLDRELSNKRVFPSLNFEKSGTRKEELLYHPDELQKIYSLRRAMKGVPSTEAMEMLISRVKKTKTNAEFLLGLAR